MSSQADDINWAVNEFADADLGDGGGPSAWWNSLMSWPNTPPPHFRKPVAMAPCSKLPIASLLMMT